jgi:hypothetical protein
MAAAVDRLRGFRGCLFWVLHGYPINELGPTLRSLDYRWVFLAVVADLAVYVAHGWRWRTLLTPVAEVSFWRTVQSIYIGLFANELLPLRPGEVIRCYLLAHWSDLRLSLTFASAALEAHHRRRLAAGRLFRHYSFRAQYSLEADFSGTGAGRSAVNRRRLAGMDRGAQAARTRRPE